MQHRSPKQCRERYHQNLKPSLNHEPISPEEGDMIEQLVQEMGKRWAEIARRLGNRSDNAVKNWWNGSMNRRKRNNLQPSGDSGNGAYRTLPIPASNTARQLYVHEPQMPLPEPYGYTTSMRPSLHGPEAQQGSYQIPNNNNNKIQHHHNIKARSAELGQCPHAETVLSQRPFLSRSRSTDRAEWQLAPLCSIEAPIHSPAATESSHGSHNQQAPSLVSDNQSTCSISPRTVTSPRPGLPAPKDLTMQTWPQIRRTNATDTHRGAKLDSMKVTFDESHQDTPPGRLSNLPRPSLAHSRSLPGPLAFSTRPARQDRSLSGNNPHQITIVSPRDTRMNVSSLLD